jgi:hypothetical protein
MVSVTTRHAKQARCFTLHRGMSPHRIYCHGSVIRGLLTLHAYRGAVMGQADIEPSKLEIFGLPGFFATEFVSTPIGDGCVRLFGGVMQGSLFVPAYYVQSPHQSILRGAAMATETAATVSMLVRRALVGTTH